MTTEVELLLTKRDVKELSNDEIYEKIRRAFTFNEYDYQLENNIKFLTGAPAKNINRLLFLCPACLSRGRMTASAKEISCLDCGLSVRVENTGELLYQRGQEEFFKRVDDWVLWQKRDANQLVKQENFSFTLDTELFLEDDPSNSHKKIAEGVLRVSREGLSFNAREFTEDKDREKYSEINYPAASLLSLSYNTDTLELYAYEGTQIYKFKEKDITYRINLMIEAIFNLKKAEEGKTEG